jgi:hypothetical protein
MHQPLKDSNSLQHNLVRGDIIYIGNKTDTAGVMFVGRIVKSLSVHIIPFFVSRNHARHLFLRTRNAKSVPNGGKTLQKMKKRK